MKKIILFILIAFLANSVNAQDFITRWDMSKASWSDPHAITFGVGTIGIVNYTWETIPAGTTGSGSFSGAMATINGIPTNAKIRLKINPTNFNRIIMNRNGGGDCKRLEDVEQWGSTQWISMDSAFYDCTFLNITSTDIPNLNQVTSMSQMFSYCYNLNGPTNIGNWNTSNVIYMNSLFYDAHSFNQAVGNWNTTNVTNMWYMFGLATNFNQAVGNWNTTNVIYMNGMFQNAITFNQPIGSWNTSNVTDMSFMLSGAIMFNQPVSNWNISNVKNMSNMFAGATNFNQPIANWNTSNVWGMSGMFNSATNFNQPIGSWNTGNVTDMRNMFRSTTYFNQPIENWNTSKVKNMSSMFEEAQTFNQSLGNWNLSSLDTTFGSSLSTPSLEKMLNCYMMGCSNYSATLNGWANNTNTPNSLKLGAKWRYYGAFAQADRDFLINTKSWTIIGDTISTSGFCYPSNISTINEKNQISISPNPTNSIFEIKGASKGAVVNLYNTFGQKLLSSKIENLFAQTGQTVLINISNFANGIYVAEIKEGNQTSRIKISKQ